MSATRKRPGLAEMKKSPAVPMNAFDNFKQPWQYDDPSKPPKWLVNEKILPPGLPLTPPPLPLEMLPPGAATPYPYLETNRLRGSNYPVAWTATGR